MSETEIAKVCFLGPSSVGKTAIINYYGKGSTEDPVATVGSASTRKAISRRDGTVVNVHLWDTAGSEQFRSLAPSFCAEASVIVYVFALNSLASFQDLKDFRLYSERALPGHLVYLVGNKSDMVSERQVTTEAASDLLQEWNGEEYFETSAKTHDGIEDLFDAIANNPHHLLSQLAGLPPRTDTVTASDESCDC
jgi:Ras-related protein Rab-5C